jgi:hypothetical protein
MTFSKFSQKSWKSQYRVSILGTPLREHRHWDNFCVSIGFILVFETLQHGSLDLNETKAGVFYNCKYCEPAKMNFEPLPINAISFANNLSRATFSFSLNLSPKHRWLRARPISNASRYTYRVSWLVFIQCLSCSALFEVVENLQVIIIEDPGVTLEFVG